MSLIFSDTLQATGGSGLYTLQALIGSDWTDIHTVSGAENGSVEVDALLNTIPVDYTLLPEGQTFEFRWVDSADNASNTVTLTIPGSAITGYSAGIGAIDFANSGGDNYTVGFHIAPTSIQSLSGATITSYDYEVDFWLMHSSTDVESGNKTGDYTLSTGSHGAGVYQVQCTYNLSDGSTFSISKLVKVDGSGTIIDSLSCDGISIGGISGLVVTATASSTQTSSSFVTYWAEQVGSSGSLLTTGETATFTISPYAVAIVAGLSLDSTFSDFGGDVEASSAMIIIS
jgi:hypothetical protein